MSDIAPSTPPFTPTPTATEPIDSWVERHSVLFVAASIALGLTAAAVVGTAIGMLVYSGSAANCHNDGWCELGAAIYGLVVGCLAGGVAHIVTGVVFVRQHLPQGKRTVPIVLHIGAPVMLFGVLLALSAL